jgi:hypothetical protein
MNRAIILAITLLLPACSAQQGVAALPLTADLAAAPTDCGATHRVADDNWTIEGFGGVDEQVIITQRQPVKRCSPAVANSKSAILDAVR